MAWNLSSTVGGGCSPAAGSPTAAGISYEVIKADGTMLPAMNVM